MYIYSILMIYVAMFLCIYSIRQKRGADINFTYLVRNHMMIFGNNYILSIIDLLFILKDNFN